MLDGVLHALADPCRREFIDYISSNEGSDLETISQNIAGDTDPQDVYAILKHTHTPMLVENGIVEFEITDETVQKGVNFDTAYHILEAAQEIDD